jgi:2-haloalkanoic acid dehalogenase type II
MQPSLLTFDIFGTVLDWRRGLVESAALDEACFDAVIDAQGRDEQSGFRPYREIIARSLVEVAGLAPERADAIGAAAGCWPLYADSREALARLRKIAPCAATTNSDRAHGEQVQAQLGFRLDAWLCAEELELYKPDERFFRAAAARLGKTPGRQWWHVSAYGDYDLEVARRLGLTCVYVARPHARPGPADVTVGDLTELADRLAARPAVG